MLKRLDVQSRIMLGVTGCLIIICIVFGIYRTATGEYDKAIILMVTLALVSVVFTLIILGRLVVARTLFIAIMYALLVVINLNYLEEQILWQYPGIVAMTFALRGYKEVVAICVSLVTLNTLLLSSHADMNLLVTYAGSQLSLMVLCAVVVELLMSNIRTAQVESETDSLTGLSNRKAFDTHLQLLFERTKQQQTSILILIDIDNFKSINDNYGHPFGDQVLRKVAAQIKATIRRDDFAFRYGGEEFAVLLPNTTLVLARSTAERLRLAIEQTPIDTEEGGVISCTASIGIAPSIESTSNEWLRRCDAFLYEAKKHGRNCIRYDTSIVNI